MQGIISYDIAHLRQLSLDEIHKKNNSNLDDSTIRHYVSITNQYNKLLKILKSLNRQLPDDILREILSYIKSISSDINLSIDMIQQVFLSIEFRKNQEPYTTLESMKSLLYDQIHHFKSTEIDCNIWHIDCMHNNHELGSICMFHNHSKPMIFDGKFGMMIQDIVKYPIPYMVQLLFPKYNAIVPKLNTALEVPINMIAVSVNVSYIFVRPIHNQGSLLIKYYGYKESQTELSYPCVTISIGFDKWLYREVLY